MSARLLAADSDGIAAAVAVLQQGGLVAFPTDTVYGLGALLNDGGAITRLYEVKERPEQKAIPVLLAGQDQLDLVAAGQDPRAELLAQAFWPGPLTLILPRRPDLPAALGPEETVGVRVPDHDFTRELLRRTGPLAATSANLSGAANSRSAQEVHQQLGERIELILDGGAAPGGQPSTVVDARGDLKILRSGPLSEADLRAALGSGST